MKRLRILVGLALIAALLMGVFACAANTTTPSPTVQTTPQAPTAAAAVTPVASATPKTLATLTPTPTTVISNQEAKSSFTPANPRVEAIGEPVPGAEIYVELEPDTGPVGRYVTNGKAEFSFNYPPIAELGKKSPAILKFKLTITPPKETRYQLSEGKTNKVTIEVKTSDGPLYTFVLRWVVDDAKTNNRGSFAVSGKSDS